MLHKSNYSLKASVAIIIYIHNLSVCLQTVLTMSDKLMQLANRTTKFVSLYRVLFDSFV